jgi:hypothetical protein
MSSTLANYKQAFPMDDSIPKAGFPPAGDQSLRLKHIHAVDYSVNTICSTLVTIYSERKPDDGSERA